ncbi:hypothetical protein ACLKMH_09370 [Psychromonas sp. KJ10-10]|uniref:hypothetical protein n=1 Tax=Psychromonas sp. KJ10-10 TaxID=3391823 RepID=UPI0039B608F2
MEGSIRGCEKMNVKTKIMSRIATSNESILDVEFYRSSYPDLSQLSNKRLKNHWHFKGKKEGRFPNLEQMLLSKGIKSIDEFNFELDLDFYLLFYPDLTEAGITSLQQAKIHWLTNGKSENRFRTMQQWVDSNNGVLYLDLDKFKLNDIILNNKNYSLNVTDILNIAVGKITQPISIYADNKKDAEFYENLGVRCYLEYRNNKTTQSIQATRSAWQMSLYFHQNGEVLEHLGNTYLDQSDYRTAQKIYQSAIAIKLPELSMYLTNNILFCYESQQRIKQGVEFLSSFENSKLMEFVGDYFFTKQNYQDAESAYMHVFEASSKPSLKIIERLLECSEKQFSFQNGVKLLVSLQKKCPEFTYSFELLKSFIQKFYWDYLGVFICSQL